ncbi:STE20-like protein [Mya arenaria]|uniref:STE20-like protein n=1 Tax=Mya arenaria TaxID=6604 RepID=A0ABY7FY23_MYAAR|nr:STE20-like protein [Mya arenaria]
MDRLKAYFSKTKSDRENEYRVKSKRKPSKPVKETFKRTSDVFRQTAVPNGDRSKTDRPNSTGDLEVLKDEVASSGAFKITPVDNGGNVLAEIKPNHLISETRVFNERATGCAKFIIGGFRNDRSVENASYTDKHHHRIDTEILLETPDGVSPLSGHGGRQPSAGRLSEQHGHAQTIESQTHEQHDRSIYSNENEIDQRELEYDKNGDEIYHVSITEDKQTDVPATQNIPEMPHEEVVATGVIYQRELDDDNNSDELCDTETNQVDATDGSGLKRTITSQMLTELEDVMDAMTLADEHGVPVDGLDSVEEMLDRFRLHMQKQAKSNAKEKIERSMVRAGQDDRKRRIKLAEVMRDMKTIVNRQGPEAESKRPDSEFVQELLRTEGTSSETSAGKSSVLNLLLEDDLLPVHNNSSTSTITVVRYHTRRHVRIVYKTPMRSDDVFDLDTEGMQRLHAIAFMKSASEREHHDVQEVQVFLPLPLLQGGLVLVDTPGIGENEFLETELVNFISGHHIRGFVYIIKTDNAGGVQEDRIVIEQQRSTTDVTGRRSTFDPKSALFVCNRVDLVQKSEVEKVKQNAIDKLSACWPCFDESQVLFLSTERARQDVQADKDYINDHFRRLLDSLKELYISALEKRIKQSYKWIENVQRRTVHHLKAVVRRLDMTDMDLKVQSDATRKRLTRLQDKSHTVLLEQRKKVDAKAEELYHILLKLLSSEKCKEFLTTGWSGDEIPKVDMGLGDWKWIKTHIQEAFFDKMMAYVEQWERDEEIVEKIEADITSKVKLELQILQEELESIEREIDGESSSVSSDGMSTLGKSRRCSIMPLSPTKLKLMIAEPKMPIKLAGRVTRPFKAVFEPFKNKMKVNEYKNNPVSVAEDCARVMYNELCSGNVRSRQGEENIDPPLSVIANYLMQRPRDYLNAIERKVPEMILSNQLLLNHVEERLDTERMYQNEYVEMMEATESLRKSLREYGEGYIFVEDFNRGELQILKPTVDGREGQSVAFNVCDFMNNSSGEVDYSRRRDIRGLWTVSYGGILVRNGLERPVAIRVYLPSSGVDFTFKEVAKLRCLSCRNTNIAEFLGIHNAETPTPAFVYDGDLRSLRKWLATGFCSRRDLVPEMLLEVACGLEYLHNKGLVHMELTQDTITLDEEGNVRLTGACLPRHAHFPDYRETTEAGDFVYLAPEVLRKERYEPPADIYSFGLLVLEMIHYGVPAVFGSERRMTLYDFADKVNPEAMLNLDKTLEIFTIKTRALIINCLDKDPRERPCLKEVVEFTDLIKTEKEALDKFPTRRSKAVIKKPSFERT